MATSVFKLSGLTCPACKKLVEKRIGTIDGVKLANVDLTNNSVEITSEKELQRLDVENSLRDTPYKIIN